ncbi:MAG: hypothetical protein V4684_15595 [Pseudomonadota bacterium]
MSAIDPANQLAALIRVQLASLRERRQTGSAMKKGADFAPSPVTANSTPATPDIGAIVARRIGAIDPGDPQRGSKAFRLFLETVILSELGQALANDPSFPVMLDHVQQQMESDPDLAKAAGDAAHFLIQAADARLSGAN